LVSYQLQLVVRGGLIESVVAYVRLAQLNEAANMSSLALSYGIAFQWADQGPARVTSGRPGYKRGLPLLFADGGLSSLVLRTHGLFMLPTSAAGACDPVSGKGKQVLFDEWLASSCSYTYSLEALEAACTADPAQPDPLLAALNISLTSTVDSAFASTYGDALIAGYVGVYGDSHPQRTDGCPPVSDPSKTSPGCDWLPITLALRDASGIAVTSSSSLVRTWDPPTQSCRNMLSGIHLHVLSADVGNVLLPVRKVVGARLEVSYQTVSARRCPLGRKCDTTVSVSATTSFTTLPRDGRAYEFVPQTPQLIPSLPSDFFYPFFIGDSSQDA